MSIMLDLKQLIPSIFHHRIILYIFQMAYDKMVAICLDFILFVFQISNPLQNPENLQTNLFLTIPYTDSSGFQIPTVDFPTLTIVQHPDTYYDRRLFIVLRLSWQYTIRLQHTHLNIRKQAVHISLEHLFFIEMQIFVILQTQL